MAELKDGTVVSVSDTDKEAARIEALLSPRSLVKAAVSGDNGIRQWVKTGSIPQKQLVEAIAREGLEERAVEQTAEFARKLHRVKTLRATGLTPLRLPARLLPYRRRQHKLRFAREEREASTDLKAAEAALREVMLEEAKRQLRARANSSRSDLFSTRLPRLEYEGLAETVHPQDIVTTSARRQLDQFVRNMPGGSIGLAGPRGAGKSTLIRTICPLAERQSIIGIVVSAPVDFSAREFILHLFAELCRTVLGREVVERLRLPDPLSPRRRPWLALRLLSAAAVLAIVGGLLMILDSLLPGIPTFPATLIWGVALVIAGNVALYWLWFRRTFRLRMGLHTFRMTEMDEPDRGFSRRAVDLASRRLKDIWFQQTFTSGWSGALKLPIGVEGGLSGNEELARQQMSMPDIVAELRRLIEEIARPRPTQGSGSRRSVRIGIDELDKIDSAESARRFMNEIKVLFGIPNCFFFVSVSEDAMSDFERRGLPFRDVFDSSFDDIVRVGYLDAASAIALVQGRVIGMPIPFILLGHCMAGGLARDLIRVVRDIVGLASREPQPRLSEVCDSLVRLDVRGKAAASVQACTRLDHNLEVERLQAWFRKVQATPVEVDSLLGLCDHATRDLDFLKSSSAENEAVRTPAGLALEFLAFCLFAASLLQYFSDERSPESFEAAVPVSGASPIDQLAEARQAFTISSRAAWDSILGFRKENGLAPNPEFPSFDRS